jgi:hypothetical protein
MVLDMLYRHEKNEFSKRKQTSLEPISCYSQTAYYTLSLDGLRVQFQNVLTALSLAINLVRPGGRLY